MGEKNLTQCQTVKEKDSTYHFPCALYGKCWLFDHRVVGLSYEKAFEWFKIPKQKVKFLRTR